MGVLVLLLTLALLHEVLLSATVIKGLSTTSTVLLVLLFACRSFCAVCTAANKQQSVCTDIPAQSTWPAHPSKLGCWRETCNNTETWVLEKQSQPPGFLSLTHTHSLSHTTNGGLVQKDGRCRTLLINFYKYCM